MICTVIYLFVTVSTFVKYLIYTTYNTLVKEKINLAK